jgi:hypothetical protein
MCCGVDNREPQEQFYPLFKKGKKDLKIPVEAELKLFSLGTARSHLEELRLEEEARIQQKYDRPCIIWHCTGDC